MRRASHTTLPALLANPAFTLLEMLTGIAIIAALVTAGLFYVGSYIADSRNIARRQTLTILNDALTRYKTQGGGTSGLTAGASIGRILSQLQNPVSWCGTSHQFLQRGVTYPARSLKATGDASQYRFYSYDGYTAETPAMGVPTSDYPYGQGIGYLKVKGTEGLYAGVQSSSGWWALSMNGGTPIIFQTNKYVQQSYSPTLGYGLTDPSFTFWACKSQTDSALSTTGAITVVNCDAHVQTLLHLSDLNVRGLTEIQTLWCQKCDYITNLNLKDLSKLASLYCSFNGMQTLNISGCANLVTLGCAYNALTSLDVSNRKFLTYVDCENNSLQTVNATNCSALTTLKCYYNQLGTITITGCTSLPAPILPKMPGEGDRYLSNFTISGNPNPEIVGP